MATRAGGNTCVLQGSSISDRSRGPYVPTVTRARQAVCDVAVEPNPTRRRQQPSRGVFDPTWSRIVHIASMPRLSVTHSSARCSPCDTSGMSLDHPVRRRCPSVRRQERAQGSEPAPLWNRVVRTRRGQSETRLPPTVTPLYATLAASRCSQVNIGNSRAHVDSTDMFS